jgi:hypothetical protein
MLPFWISIAVLSLVQGAVVALPRALVTADSPGRVRRVGNALLVARTRAWAVIPALSVAAFVVVAGAAEHPSARAMTYLALLAVPLLALLAAALRGARWGRLAFVAVPALFALAWADRGGLAGDSAALALTALSCVALGTLLAWVTPARWLGAGLVVMAAADTALVVSDLLQKPNNALNAAHPAAGLPRLQSAVFGSAVMGYGDLFAAACLGALLALAAGPALQRRAAVLTALVALAMDLLFFAVDELPATVPVALSLLALVAARRLRAARRARPPGVPAPVGARLAVTAGARAPDRAPRVR